MMQNPKSFLLFQDLPESEMVWVEGTTQDAPFRLGSTDDDQNVYDSEKPRHPVQVRGFYLGKYPVTQAVWERVMGHNPSYFKGCNRPVEQVSWADIKQQFIPTLEQLLKKTGHIYPTGYGLPSEAQWEYAAKGGKHWEEGFVYAGGDKVEEVGWFRGNSQRMTQAVGLKLPNALGLYDMSGNVWEWCENEYQNYPLSKETVNNNKLTKYSFTPRVFRGGSCYDEPQYLRSATRDGGNPSNRYGTVGFRLSKTL